MAVSVALVSVGATDTHHNTDEGTHPMNATLPTAPPADGDTGGAADVLAAAAPFDAATASPDDFDYLTRDEVAEADDMTFEDVLIPEWAKGRAAKIRVKSLTGTERDRFESSILVPDGKGRQIVTTEQMRAKLVVMAAVFPPAHPKAGERMFGDMDIDWLSGKNAAALDRVFTAAQKLAGLSDEDVDELKTKLGEAVAASTSE